MVNLIINADDFGMSHVYNDVILELLSGGQISSTTVMVNRITDYQVEQVKHLKYLMNYEPISVGLHTEFTYDNHLEQVEDQFAKFEKIFERQPTHIDIHKEHLHRAYHPLVAEFCKSKGVPFRNHGSGSIETRTTEAPYFYGSVPDFNSIDHWLKGLKNEKDYELVFHPGCYDPNCYSSLNRDRELDVAHIRRIFSEREQYHLNLISFKQLSGRT